MSARTERGDTSKGDLQSSSGGEGVQNPVMWNKLSTVPDCFKTLFVEQFLPPVCITILVFKLLCSSSVCGCCRGDSQGSITPPKPLKMHKTTRS